MVKDSTEGKNGQIGSGAFPRDVDYAMPSPDVLQLALNAAKPFEGYKQSPDIIEAAGKIGKEADRAVQEAEKQATIRELESAIANTGDSSTKLELGALLSKVRSAKSSNEIRELLNSASTAAQNAMGASNGAEQVDAAAMHKSFYANDAIYRAKVDAIMGEADAAHEKITDRDKKTAAQLKNAGIATSVDADIDGLEEERKRLRAPMDDHAILKLDEKLTKLRIIQVQEALPQAEALNRPDLVELLKKEQPQRKTELEEATKRLIEAQKALYAAMERDIKFKNPTISDEKLKNELADWQKTLETRKEEVLATRDAGKIIRLADRTKDEAAEKQHPNASAETQKRAATTKGDGGLNINDIDIAAIQMAVAPASHADEKTPNSIPAPTAGTTPKGRAT